MRIHRVAAWTVIAVASGFVWFGAVGCEDDRDTAPTRRTTDIDVDDKLLGGKEVKETEVIEQGDRKQVRERKTEFDSEGKVTKEEIEVSGDEIK